MSRQLPPEKSLTYFALLKAFGQRGCPICRLMEEFSLSYLDNLFYERVNDVGTRRKLRSARGFCNRHAWQARQIATSALGVAIIAKDLISEELERLDDLLRRPFPRTAQGSSSERIPRKSLLAFIQRWHRKGICPACQIISEHERDALATILDFLHDPEFAGRFGASPGLCVVHTMCAAEGNGSHPHLRTLLAMQRCKYARLVEDLEEFCRKHDYRFSQQPWGSESDAWLRAIELLTGKPGVFGSGVHRSSSSHGFAPWWAKFINRCRQWGVGRDQQDGL